MYALFREAVPCMTVVQFLTELMYPSRTDVDEIIKVSCTKCGEQSFLQKEFDVCPHCLEWDHEGEYYD